MQANRLWRAIGAFIERHNIPRLSADHAMLEEVYGPINDSTMQMFARFLHRYSVITRPTEQGWEASIEGIGSVELVPWQQMGSRGWTIQVLRIGPSVPWKFRAVNVRQAVSDLTLISNESEFHANFTIPEENDVRFMEILERNADSVVQEIQPFFPLPDMESPYPDAVQHIWFFYPSWDPFPSARRDGARIVHWVISEEEAIERWFWGYVGLNYLPGLEAFGDITLFSPASIGGPPEGFAIQSASVDVPTTTTALFGASMLEVF